VGAAGALDPAVDEHRGPDASQERRALPYAWCGPSAPTRTKLATLTVLDADSLEPVAQAQVELALPLGYDGTFKSRCAFLRCSQVAQMREARVTLLALLG
jgi:hypothetical protein